MSSSSEPHSPAPSPAELIELLWKEYGLIKSEMQTYINLFHRHTQFLTLYLSLIVGGLSLGLTWLARPGALQAYHAYFLIEHLLPWPLEGHAIRAYEVLAFLTYFVITTVGFFFVSATIGYIYIIEVLAARARAIEEQINQYFGAIVMTWEITISPRLIRGIVRSGLWVSPSALRITWGLIILGVVVAIEIVTAGFVMGPLLALAYFVYLGTAGVFQVVQLLEYRSVGLRQVETVVSAASAFEKRLLTSGQPDQTKRTK